MRKVKPMLVILAIVGFVVAIPIFYYVSEFIFGFFGGSPWSNYVIGQRVDNYLEDKYKDLDFTIVRTYKDFFISEYFSDIEVIKDKQVLFTTKVQYQERTRKVYTNNIDVELNKKK